MTHPHYRRCWECGAINLHADNYGPEVACKKCRSMDTRLLRNGPPLWGIGPGIYVPRGIAKCPECQSELVAQCIQCDEEGRPIATGIELDCVKGLHEACVSHTFSQDKWQPIRDAVSRWCDARVDYPGR